MRKRTAAVCSVVLTAGLVSHVSAQLWPTPAVTALMNAAPYNLTIETVPSGRTRIKLVTKALPSERTFEAETFSILPDRGGIVITSPGEVTMGETVYTHLMVTIDQAGQFSYRMLGGASNRRPADR